MSDKIRILGIAPYSGMKSQMQLAAESYSNVELLALDGDLQAGVIAAQNHFHSDFDVIISRGGTAQMLRSQVEIPVVDVRISEYDILRSIRLAQQVSKRFAVVGFPNIVSAFENISELLPVTPAIFSTEHADDIDGTMHRIFREGYSTVICDVASAASAKAHHLNAILISSGPQSIHQAIQDAVLLIQHQLHLRDENKFLKELIYHHSNDTVIFDTKQNLYFSTCISSSNMELLNLLRSEIPSCSEEQPQRIVKCLNGNLYTIKGQKIPFGEQYYYVFFLSKSKAPFLLGRSGIRYFSKQNLLQDYLNTFSSYAFDQLKKTYNLNKLSESSHPIMILGEEGCGKESAAKALYLQGKNTAHPFIEINCSLLNYKSWDFLESSHHSPFADSNTTIYIAEIDSIPEPDFQHLLAILLDMEVCKRNMVYFSSAQNKNSSASARTQLLCNKLCCLSFALPPLRERSEDIPTLINLYFSQLAVTEGSDIVGMDNEAMKLMADFSWPHNIAQFKRIMDELCTKSLKPVISMELVSKILDLENKSPLLDGQKDNAERFNINRPLHDIEADIVQHILEKCGGNQSLAAKKLGISRTTIWRILQSK